MSDPAAQPSPRRDWRGRALGGAAGLLVVALLVRALGAGHIAAYVGRVGAGMSWLMAAYLVANLFYAAPFGLLLPRAARPSWGALLASRFAAVSVNAATPFLGVGGEPARLLWLAPTQRRRAVAALFVDRGAFLAASALFLLAGVVTAVVRIPLPRAAKAALVAVALLAVAAAAALYRLQRRGGVAQPLARFLALFAPRHRERLTRPARELDDHIRDLHLDGGWRFGAALALHLGGRAAGALEVYAGARLLGLPVGAEGTLVLAALPLAVDFAFSMVPSQIGLHEGATALLAGALGLDPAAGVALAFLQRVRQVVFVTLGFVLLTLRPRRFGDDRGDRPAVTEPVLR